MISIITVANRNLDNILAANSTLKQIGDCLQRNGPMTTAQICQALNLSKTRVYEALRSRDTVGLAIGGKIRFIATVGGDKLSGYVFGFSDAQEYIDYEMFTTDTTHARGDASVVDQWLAPTLKRLRAERDNPFALLALPRKTP